jgi:FG-GAP repeat
VRGAAAQDRVESRAMRHPPRLVALCVAVLGAPVAAQSLLFELAGGSPEQRFGGHVSAAGDIDGDGLPDLLVGAPGDATLGSDTGAAEARRGFDGALLHSWLGEAGGDEFGVAVARVGDVNADGHDDALIGAYRCDAIFLGGGRAYIMSGADGAPLLVLDPDGDGDDEFGIALAGIGDVDGDGVPDVAIGAHHDDLPQANMGSVRVCSGADGSTIHLVKGDEDHDDLGHAVDGCGDVDLDGVPDFLGGLHDITDAGRVRLYSGADGAVLDEWTGSTPGDFFGHAVSGAGDADLDGVPDLLVGASRDDDAGLNAGRAWIYTGVDGTTLHSWTGEAPGDQLGLWVDDAGDWDDDGVPDVILGVPGDDDAGAGAGSARIKSGATGAELLHWNGGSPGLRFDTVVAGLGDVDANGRLDVAISFPYDDGAALDAGLVQVVQGPLASPWTVLGGGLAGAAGIPNLAGTGTLAPGTPGSLLITDAAPAAPCMLFFSLVSVSVPFKGGTLSAFPPLATFLLVTGPAGGVQLPWLAWPASLPPGLELYFQLAVQDTGALHGAAISNLLQGLTQP